MFEVENIKTLALESFIINRTSIYFNCVLNGSMDGKVWVNNLEKPTFLLCWNEYQKGFQWMGVAETDIKEEDFMLFYLNTLLPFLKEKQIEYIESGFDSQLLYNQFHNVFKSKNIEEDLQKFFEIGNDTKKKNIAKPQGIKTLKIDRDFLAQKFSNLEYVIDEIQNTWGNLDLFLEQGCGYVSIFNNTIIGRSMVTCRFGKSENIGIDVLPQFRKKGIGSYLSSLVLDDLRERGQEPIWDCTSDNFGSESIALKIGLQNSLNFPICWFSI